MIQYPNCWADRHPKEIKSIRQKHIEVICTPVCCSAISPKSGNGQSFHRLRDGQSKHAILGNYPGHGKPNAATAWEELKIIVLGKEASHQGITEKGLHSEPLDKADDSGEGWWMEAYILTMEGGRLCSQISLSAPRNRRVTEDRK